MTTRHLRVGVVALVCLVLAGSTLLVPLSHHRGLLGWDSDLYLRQAAFFLEGRGIEARGLVEPEPFTTWPLGYPLIVAGVAKVSGLSLFWAGRLTSLLAALASVALLVNALPRTGWLASTALLSGGMLGTFAATYAETVFIPAVLASVLALARVLRDGSWRHGVVLTLAVALAFYTRYVGLLLLGPVLVGFCWAHLAGRRRVAKTLVLSALGASALILPYLLLIRSLIGSLLPPRQPRTEPLGRFVYETAKAFASEANFVFLRVPSPRDAGWLAAFTAVLVLSLILAIRVFRRAPAASPRGWIEALPSSERWTIPVLLGCGVYFYACMVGLKLLYHFNPLAPRLLGPGTVLVLAGGLALAWNLGLREQPGSKVVLGTLVIGSVLFSGVYEPVRNYLAEPVLFPERIEAIRQRYAAVEPGSIVLLGPVHLFFVRPDVQVVPPRRVASPEHLDTFLERALDTGNPVWLNAEDGLRRLDEARE